MKRRDLLRNGVLAGVATAAPRAWAAPAPARVLGANDRIRVALIGAGGMGRSNLTDFLKVKNVEAAAVCDVDDEQTGKAMKLVEAAGAPAPASTTRDFRKVLDDKSIDAVVVATPDHWHALMTVLACQAGKDVYVEKPAATTIAEGRAMVTAARAHKRVVQVGTQQRSAGHFRDAVEHVKSGKLGKIRLVRAWAYLDWKAAVPIVADAQPPANVDYDLWLGPARKRPFNKNRFHFTFRWFWDYSGGLMTDWGAHMIDVANWAMGVKAPTSAQATGGKLGFPNDAMETPDTMQTLFAYPGFNMVWEHALGVGRGPEGREHGVAFHGQDGVLVVDRNGWQVFAETERLGPRRTFRSAGVPWQPPTQNFHLAHVQNFVDCMRTRAVPTSDIEVGHDSIIACHLGNIAYRLGRQVKWDVAGERIVGDAEAQRHVGREYRGPWKLPRVA